MEITNINTDSYTSLKKDNLFAKKVVLEYQKAKRNAETIKQERMVYENKRRNG